VRVLLHSWIAHNVFADVLAKKFNIVTVIDVHRTFRKMLNCNRRMTFEHALKNHLVWFKYATLPMLKVYSPMDTNTALLLLTISVSLSILFYARATRSFDDVSVLQGPPSRSWLYGKVALTCTFAFNHLIAFILQRALISTCTQETWLNLFWGFPLVGQNKAGLRNTVTS
jgi:hypothetical protein